MEYQSKDREETSSFCTFQFFDCFSKTDKSERRFSTYPSIKKELNVSYQQPHLVEPMKLRVYAELPKTPTTPEPSQLTQWGRNLASRASSRTSKVSAKNRATSKSAISRPQPVPETSTDLPLRRRREYTPLQLSIYVDTNRLSDLPEFNRFSFTDLGELKAPPKVLVRTQSESMLRKDHGLLAEPSKRTASMYETSDITFARPETSYSIVSTSRPPSGYEALHSHPVSWASLPGIPAPKSQKTENTVAVMTPMQEEFSPIATTVTVDGTVLNFPKGVQSEPNLATSELSSTVSQAPYPTVSQGPSGTATTKSRDPSARTCFYNKHQTQQRISQWLQHRSQSNSTSTIGSVSTTKSFSEHRRKRSEFYQLTQPAQVPAAITTSSSSPPPFRFPTPLTNPQHHRTNTGSTIQTVSTSVLSSSFDKNSKRNSEESMTTYSMADIKSRTGTIKSVASPDGLRIITMQERDRDVVVSPAFSGEIINQRKQEIYLEEIGGPLRSPGVGIAF